MHTSAPSWSTRVVLGEELWITERPGDTAMAVNATATLAGITALIVARDAGRGTMSGNARVEATLGPSGARSLFWRGLVGAGWGLWLQNLKLMVGAAVGLVAGLPA